MSERVQGCLVLLVGLLVYVGLLTIMVLQIGGQAIR